MTHILTKAEVRKVLPIPDELHRYITRITGQLVCTNCKAVIIDEGIEYNDYTSESIQYQVAAHICGSDLKRFKFDFNDPRTMIEQLVDFKTKKARPRW